MKHAGAIVFLSTLACASAAKPDSPVEATTANEPEAPGPIEQPAPQKPPAVAVSACEGATHSGVLVRTVDEHGAPANALWVQWLDPNVDFGWSQPDSPQPGRTPARCTNAAASPCAEWIIDGALPARFEVSAAGHAANAPAGCLPFSAAIGVVHATDPSLRQVLTLVLPSGGTVCDESTTLWHHVPSLADCLATPAPVSGKLKIRTVDTGKNPLPAMEAWWYYAPSSPEHDGDHPLTCVDARCETWVATDLPAAGRVYVGASYLGPINPHGSTDWDGYNAFAIDLDDGATVEAPQEVQIELSIHEIAY